jgi:hypothetical protein
LHTTPTLTLGKDRSHAKSYPHHYHIRARRPRPETRDPRTGLTRAATKAQCPLMMTVYAVLAFFVAANAVVAFAAISKLEEPHGH